jgi:hypothetical protein
MALETKTAKILKLPEMATSSRVRELQWGIDWWEKTYKESQKHEETAKQLWLDAIDNGDSLEQINSLFIVLKMFESNRIAAWHEWQECKRQYLELLN